MTSSGAAVCSRSGLKSIQKIAGDVLKIKSKYHEYEPIGKRIKKIRQEQHMTQEQLAEKLNVSNQHISDIERGLNGMSIPALMEICKALDSDADYILFGTSTRAKSNPINRVVSRMTPSQSMYAEEILIAYAKACRII